jgi:hypothetical protein
MEGSGRGIMQVTIGTFVLILTYQLVTLSPDRGPILGPPKLQRTLPLCTVNFDKQHIEGYMVHMQI